MMGEDATLRRAARIHTPTALGREATRDIAGALNVLVADVFALYLKTRNFHWHRLQRTSGNDADSVSPLDMLAELREDNLRLAAHMREMRGICDERGDIVTASLLEGWIDEVEQRAWFLFEATRKGGEPGH